MIKKIIISSIIIICLLSPVSTFAMELSLPQLGGLADLGYGLSIGANFDFSNSKYVVENWDNLSTSQRAEAVRAAAWDFMADYSISRGIPYATSAGALPLDEKGFFKSVYFESNVKNVFSNYLTAEDAGLNSDATLRMPISRQAVTDWALYRENAWERYKSSFVVDTEDEIDPVLPSEYSWVSHQVSLYVRNLEFVQNENVPWAYNNGQGQGATFYFDRTQVTYYSPSTYLQHTDPGNNYMYYGALGIYDGILKIEFNTETNQATYTNAQPWSGALFSSVGSIFSGNAITNVSKNYGTYNGTMMDYMSVNGSATISFDPRTDFTGSGINTFLNYIYQQFCNFDLYVDGLPWILIPRENAPANPVIPDFPDVINPNGDLPVDLVDLPATDGNVGTFDITSLFDALMEAISGASDTDNTTSGTLSGEAVTDSYRDTTGELVADESIPLADIIDDSFPIQDTKNFPNLPFIDEPIHNAFSGTTILSQLIHACDTVFPSELMLVFWGIVFTLFIIGLVKILHK